MIHTRNTSDLCRCGNGWVGMCVGGQEVDVELFQVQLEGKSGSTCFMSNLLTRKRAFAIAVTKTRGTRATCWPRRRQTEPPSPPASLLSREEVLREDPEGNVPSSPSVTPAGPTWPWAPGSVHRPGRGFRVEMPGPASGPRGTHVFGGDAQGWWC